MMRFQFVVLCVVGIQMVDATASKSFAAGYSERPVAAEKSGTCWRLTIDLQAGAAVTLDEVMAVPCDPEQSHGAEKSTRLFRYDRSGGQVVMLQGARSGQYLGRVVLGRPVLVQAGTVGTLVARVGAVEVSRSVDVRQAGVTGNSVFVSLPRGEVISAVVSPLNGPATNQSENGVGAQ